MNSKSMTLAEAERSGRDTVTVTEAGQIVGISRDAAYDAVKRGEFPHRKIGGRIVIPVALLREWLGVQ